MLNIKHIIWIIVLVIEGCSTSRIIVTNCIDIDNFGKYKICDLVIEK